VLSYAQLQLTWKRPQQSPLFAGGTSPAEAEREQKQKLETYEAFSRRITKRVWLP